MLFDFLQQFFYAGLCFVGLAGVGLFVLRSLGFSKGNLLLNLSLAYFTSLCLYTVFIVAGLFIASDKRQILLYLTLFYGLASFGFLGYLIRQKWSTLRSILFENRFIVIPISIILPIVTFFFFLQIYHTAVLDEWLHRPIVQEFVTNGVFPLVNPLDPTSDYIHTYHYGTQVIAAAFQLVFRLDVPASLDLLKLSYFIATLFLFYGLIFHWTRQRALSLGGAVLVLFSGSSFFFLDSFTASHLISFDGLGLPAGQRWPINAPLSYILSGITWVNIPLTIAFGFLIETIFSKKENLLSWRGHLCLGVLLVGFFLMSELFAAAVLTLYMLMFVYRSSRESVPFMFIITMLAAALIVIACGVYITGGIIGDMINRTMIQSQTLLTSPTASISEQEGDIRENSYTTMAPILDVKPFSAWGYPSEKRVLIPWDVPMYYLRSLLMEIGIVLLWLFLLVTKRVTLSDKPVLMLVTLIGLAGPFILTTRFGDLNLAKTVTLSFVLLHLLVFYWLSYIEGRKRIWLMGSFLALFAISAISGFLMGPNIQWQIVSAKGREQYCSQNPVCYKGEFTELLRRFEYDQPGLKHIQTDPKNAAKVADLTNAHVYRQVIPGLVEYVVETPEFRKTNPDRISGRILYESGEYRIWQVN